MRLKLGHAAVSRAIKRLESQLNCQLFLRTTREIKLTDEGALYYEQCMVALNALSLGEECLRGQKEEVDGHLSVSVPQLFSYEMILPYLAEFSRTYPQLMLDLRISSTDVNFIKHDCDLSIRLIRETTDISPYLIEKMIGYTTLGLYASPNYLEQYGVPETQEDLKQHRCINFAFLEMPLFPVNFTDHKGMITIHDDLSASKQYACHDGGIVQLFDFCVTEEVKNGQLIRLLPEEINPQSWRFSFLYPISQRNNKKVRVFSDFILQHAQSKLSNVAIKTPRK